MTHRVERRELEHRVDSFSSEVAGHDPKVADLEMRRSNLERGMRTRAQWEARHGTDLERLDTLERQIDVTERLDQVASHARDRGVDHGIEIGM